MATLTHISGSRSRRLVSEVAGWWQENVVGAPYKNLFNIALAWAAFAVFRSQFDSAPALTGAIGVVWLLGLIGVVAGALTHRFNAVTQWLKERLYNSPASALVTLFILLLVSGLAQTVWAWAVVNASFSADPKAAAASDHAGATWGIIFANIKLLMVGQFDIAELWRVWASVAILIGLSALSFPVYGPFKGRLRPIRPFVTWAWLLSPPALWVLLRGIGEGGFLGQIESRTWGGLLLTLIISVFAIVVSFPLGVLLALGRRSTIVGIPAWLTYGVVGAAGVWGLVTYTQPNLVLARTPLEYVLILWPLWLLIAGVLFQRVFKGNVVSAFCTVYIECVRGVPLITVLFMANFLLPLFLPPGAIIENAFRAMWGFMFFSAAYLAENVRGGLQSISSGQYEAAQALGLNTFQQLWFVILPQALRVVIPPIVGQFIGLFKDTTLVAVVGLFDLLGIANAAVAQPDWLGLRREVYVFVSVVYYIGCFAMAAASRWLERRLRVGQH
jgi:general L-amino acid transport system permease protein